MRGRGWGAEVCRSARRKKSYSRWLMPACSGNAIWEQSSGIITGQERRARPTRSVSAAAARTISQVKGHIVPLNQLSSRLLAHEAPGSRVGKDSCGGNWSNFRIMHQTELASAFVKNSAVFLFQRQNSLVILKFPEAPLPWRTLVSEAWRLKWNCSVLWHC